LDGVTFPAAEILIEFINPVDATEAMFPTGNLVDNLKVPNIGTFKEPLNNLAEFWQRQIFSIKACELLMLITFKANITQRLRIWLSPAGRAYKASTSLL